MPANTWTTGATPGKTAGKTSGKTSGKTPHPERARVTAPQRSPQERLRVWRHASVAAARATQHIHATTRPDPASAADAAWAAADLLTGVAYVVEGRRGGPLTQAAETYDRAARELHREVPKPTSSGRGLRTATRLLLDAGTVLQPRSELVQLAALLRQLIALAQAVERLRLAQSRLAQATAARAAARQLVESSPTWHPARAVAPPVPTTAHAPRSRTPDWFRPWAAGSAEVGPLSPMTTTTTPSHRRL